MRDFSSDRRYLGANIDIFVLERVYAQEQDGTAMALAKARRLQFQS